MLMTGNVYEHFWYQLPQVMWEKWPLLLLCHSFMVGQRLLVLHRSVVTCSLVCQKILRSAKKQSTPVSLSVAKVVRAKAVISILEQLSFQTTQMQWSISSSCCCTYRTGSFQHRRHNYSQITVPAS